MNIGSKDSIEGAEMKTAIKGKEIVNLLESVINNDEKVIAFADDDKHLLSLLYDELGNRMINNVKIYHCVSEVPNHKGVARVSKLEMEEILEMYRTYDFSDQLLVVSNSSINGSMYNYVKTGILTKQEMIDALLKDLVED